jgi:hypothetical protein
MVVGARSAFHNGDADTSAFNSTNSAFFIVTRLFTFVEPARIRGGGLRFEQELKDEKFRNSINDKAYYA